jgi:hypothetical protein
MSDSEHMVRVEKKYIDNLLVYVKKLEDYAEYCKNECSSKEEVIQKLKKKNKNANRKNLRLKNKLHTIRMERLEQRIQDEIPPELEDWIVCED